MGKKIIWVVVSCLMVLSLVMASCGPAEEEAEVEVGEEEVEVGEGVVTEEEEEEAVVAGPEVPQYGGTITVRDFMDPSCCDSFANRIMSGALVMWYTYEQILDFDWARGPAGTGEFDNRAVSSPDAMMGPTLVESVEKPSPEVWILNIRQGMHWQPVDSEAGRLMNSREVTADDIVWAYERAVHSPDGAIQVLQPRVAEAFKIEKTGPWQVTFTTPVQPITAQWWVIEGGGYGFLHPREVVETYGDLNDWRNTVGTGPWMITDYVEGSMVTYKKNPNYWGIDPVGPGKGNQLPYADKLLRLIIPDMSTTLAALRTGRLDLMSGISIDDAQQIIDTAPDIDYEEYLPDGFGGSAVMFNLADKTKPWADVRVRQALMMATDYDTIVNDIFKGKAEKDYILVDPNFTGAGYKPLSTMAESVQEVYRYNPEKAKQLLTDAGYPAGFKAELLVPNTTTLMDYAALFKDMWSKVDVELDIVPKETGVLTATVTRSFDWTDMVYGSVGGSPGSFGFSLYTYFGYYRGDNRLQFASRTDPGGDPDPIIEAAFAKTQENIYVNWPAAYEAVEEIRPYLIEQAFKIPFPLPNLYSFWWPWMKNTYGQGEAGYLLKYYWVDEELKRKMGF